MSLLMQALKKAEQSKQKQQSDAVLSLSPTETQTEPTLEPRSTTSHEPPPANEIDDASTLSQSDSQPNSQDYLSLNNLAANRTSAASASHILPEDHFSDHPPPTTPATASTSADLGEKTPRPRIDVEQIKSSAQAGQALASEQKKARSVFSSKTSASRRQQFWLFGLVGITVVMLSGFAYVYWQSSQIENRYALSVQAPSYPAVTNTAVVPPAPASVATTSNTATTQTATDNSKDVTSTTPSSTPKNASTAPAKTAITENKNLTGANKDTNKIPTNKPQQTPSQLAKDVNAIQIRKGSNETQIHPSLTNAYQAFLAGDTAKAEQQYQIVLSQESNNRDALIGLAAIALNQRSAEKAGAFYGKLLELDPNDPDAIAGLTSLQQGDPTQSESRLKQALHQHPNAGAILFALGNLYAQQTRWSDAQQLYFRAYTTQTGNADYAYNLAISLDRLNQAKLAKEYYQRALEAGQTGPGNFNRNSVQKRIADLEKNTQ